ncbi:dihydropteroate synthase [Corynebacterium oculi]|uniref:Dihydropteroate synthase n=1 Tax=Corynebacterium oculi TaxID=1544416 RepID=A0A0Q0TWG7_9CORY|nr:dihydropteroate synthase [Corynebacterium oculi]KQB83184.1 Dihydropteroate synthase 1 [Corynebacterium oculi]
MRVADLTVPGRCLVMGILNVTEDSFSDGGRYLDLDAAVAHAHRLVAEGADMIDVGGESTRPGATRVDAETERRRVAPVIRALAQEGIITSVDTMRASTAEAAAEAGARMINDVSGGLADDRMLAVMSQAEIPVCLMHWKTVRFGDASGQAHHEGGVVADVRATLHRLVERTLAAGVDAGNIVLDPGLGFAKSAEDNWALLGALPEFIAGEFPLLVGASRKRFLTEIRAARGLSATPVDADPATAAVTALSAQLGAWGVRVHEVGVSRDAVDVAARWNTAANEASAEGAPSCGEAQGDKGERHGG